MHGFGYQTWADGRSYEGFFKEDKKHGYGIYVWNESNTYQGSWYDGKQHGYGRVILKEGKQKFGLWKNGKKLGSLNEEQVDEIKQGTFETRLVLECTDQEWKELQDLSNLFEPLPNFHQNKQNFTAKI